MDMKLHDFHWDDMDPTYFGAFMNDHYAEIVTFGGHILSSGTRICGMEVGAEASEKHCSGFRKVQENMKMIQTLLVP